MNPDNPMLLGGAFVAGAVATLLLMPLTTWLARRLGIVDRPGGRRTHEGEIPRLGGVAIFLGLMLGAFPVAALYFGFDKLIELLSKAELIAFLAPCGIVWGIGLVDDIRGLSPAPRVAAVAIAATILMQAGYVIDSVATPWGPLDLGYAAFPITLLWFVGVTHSYNLVDGIDGLLSTVAIAALVGIAGVGLLARMDGTPMLAIALAGALGGFLYWNWHPARAFMGDSGSMLVGFAIAALALKVSRNLGGAISFHIPIALCALPLSETCLTLARRHVSGTPYLVGDRSHVHHVMLNKGLSVQRTVLTLGAVSVLLSLAAVLSRYYRTTGALVTIGLILVLIVVGLRWLGYVEARVLWDRIRRSLFKRRRRGIPEVLALIRASDAIQEARSLSDLAGRLSGATREAQLSYMAIEPADACKLDPERTVEAINPAAERYAAQSGEGSLWLFSSEVTDPAAGLYDEQVVRLPLPPGSGHLGHLVCHRYLPEGARAPYTIDVRQYLAEPLGEVLARLCETGSSSDGEPPAGVQAAAPEATPEESDPS